MDRIFLLVSWDWDDGYINEGYATSYEEACKICVWHNNRYPDNMWEIEEVECCEPEYDDTFEIKYVYNYRFDLKDGYWVEAFKKAWGKDKNETIGQRTEWCVDMHDKVNTYFVLDDFNYAVADKVARDRLNRFLEKHKDEKIEQLETEVERLEDEVWRLETALHDMEAAKNE